MVAMSWPHVRSLVPVRIKRERDNGERERRGIEDVDLPSLLVPPDQLFGREAQRDQKKLQVKPIIREPEEQVDAEDDRERAEPKGVRIASRPAQQHVERVGEDQLSSDEKGRVVDRTPVPAPIQQEDDLRAGLYVVLLSKDDLKCQCSARVAEPARTRRRSRRAARRRRRETTAEPPGSARRRQRRRTR